MTDHSKTAPGPWPGPELQDRVATWTAERMTVHGFRPTGGSSLAYHGPLAVVLRTPVDGGQLFTKASIPLFAAEARTTSALASATPAWMPRVIDIEPDEGWLLMDDLGGRLLGDAPQTAWPEGLALFARIQRAWLGRTGDLLAAGAADRPLTQLSDDLPGLLDADGLGDLLDPATRRAWPETLERLQSACGELQAIGLPDSVLHGDLHPWNIAQTEDGLRIFDWSDTAIGSPFIDLAVYLGRARPDVRPAILEPYLRAWSDIASRPALERAAELGMVLGAIDQVRTYLRIAAVHDSAEPSEFAGADAGWVENAIAALDDGLEARFSFGPEESPGQVGPAPCL